MTASSANESPYKIKKNLADLIEFAKYHRDAMTSRRSAGLKTFTGIMALFFYFAIEAPGALNQTTFDADILIIIVVFFYFGIAFIFTIVIKIIETKNDYDLQKYKQLENAIDNCLRTGEIVPAIEFQKIKTQQVDASSHKRFFKRWAGTYPGIFTWVAALICIIYFCSLQIVCSKCSYWWSAAIMWIINFGY